MVRLPQDSSTPLTVPDELPRTCACEPCTHDWVHQVGLVGCWVRQADLVGS